MSARPERLAVIAATGTEVGKTWVACAVIGELRRRDMTVAARKPVQSFEPDDGERHSTDADLLADASGEPTLTVCPPHRRYEVAMAPPMAADALGRPRVHLAELLEEVTGSWPTPPAAIGLVELAGGVRSPIAHDGDCADIGAALAPEVLVLVADAGLGTINAVSSAIDSLASTPIGDTTEVVVHLNRFDPTDDLHVRNREWLSDRAAHGAPSWEMTADIASLSDRLAGIRGRST